ncbi:MAG: repeat-containing protein [Acidobacteria bacterium]|nr:repeat-containing protein [Acidobacteriota bacterium]
MKRQTIALLLALPLLAQMPAAPPPAVPEAFAKIQAGDAAGAVAILEPIVDAEPKNARALRVLGTAYIRTRAYDKALAVLGRSLEIEPDFPAALYNIGVVHALQGDRDAAFAWLQKVKATKRMDLSSMDNDADLASLRDDPRYRALLPTAAEFASPFVEPVKILREFDGEAANDQFGWIARNIGDVDGDRIADFVTSAPTKTVNGAANAGRIYVYSSRSGKLLWTADGKAGDQLGTGVEAAGDTNKDGIPDVIASGPGNGVAFIYSGKDGHVLQSFKGEAVGDSFGQHSSGAGDVDRDGYADVIVGAPASKAGGEGAGRAYVYSGKDGHRLLTLTGSAGDALGSTVAGYADRKRFFLVVGAPGAGPKKTGRTYVYDTLTEKPKFTIEADDTGAGLGMMFVSVPGDVDGDRVPDIYASDWGNNAKGPSTGRIYVHSGRSGERLFALTGETAGEGFGTSPSEAGDLDGDGRADLAIGAWQYAGAAPSGGRIYLYSGRSHKLLGTITDRVAGDTLGFDSVGIGDVDGDGIQDLLITAAWSPIHGHHSGRVFIVSSGVKRSD